MYKTESITEYHKLAGLPKPEHPLVSLVDYSQVNYPKDQDEITVINSHYSIALKKGLAGKVRYGQQQYDFDEGLMSFVAPGQVIKVKVHKAPAPHPTGWLLLVHPDFLWGSHLAKMNKQYEFFGYDINEALFLSDKEEQSMIGIMKNIQQEYHANIDAFSQKIILSQIEVLLNYAERYYQRQFITRKISNHAILNSLESWLTDYFDKEDLASAGLPSVQQIADELNVSPNYLSNLLKVLTGQNTQQHIHDKLIEKAKEKLSTTQLSVSEIAYGLGFEHAQSFSRLFKSKTQQSPLEFRAGFN
ncbi:helix-turn-helix domain-containing protein [Reichenbachiella ulvae]|uniref:Helix-turn-helix transcriptional regulator n=1 Tax=Reichenbachiella ulvae TaxID=2980104 RepID=A0ABT3CWL9_9BACT|nr:response regulator transcription factor [Reichenbachiella ulvae]MCV9388101.1 helix-turn-helix transcriptional regulator [Reichenbachiella ulvae]